MVHLTKVEDQRKAGENFELPCGKRAFETSRELMTGFLNQTTDAPPVAFSAGQQLEKMD